MCESIAFITFSKESKPSQCSEPLVHISHFKGEESEAQKVRGSFKFLQPESGRVRTHLDSPSTFRPSGVVLCWGTQPVGW